MPTSRRLILSPLLLAVVALAGVLGVATSSAAAGPGPETRVRANATVTADAVGQRSGETAGGVGCLRPSQPDFVSGSCVATNTGTRTFGSGKPPHVADVTVTRNGEVVSQQTLRSGNMTPDEAALGFPRSTLATHTEARAVRSTSLEAGDDMLISGQYPPCPSCKGAMNQATRSSGASITYQWPDGTWTAGG